VKEARSKRQEKRQAKRQKEKRQADSLLVPLTRYERRKDKSQTDKTLNNRRAFELNQ